MNNRPSIKTASSVCPHDCPSACALQVEVLDTNTIGRIRGAKDNSYTKGVICEKVARYAERIHHPERLTTALKRAGGKGEGNWQPISFDDALDEVAEAFIKAESTYGAQTIWPYYYAGTMGLVMRDGIHRLTHEKKYSRIYETFCTALAWSGYLAGTGRLAGVDPREMVKSDLVVIWGTNPVNTQVNVMTHAMAARKNRGAKIAVIDVYQTGTMDKADIGLVLRPGTDGALACAIMHVLFRDGLANWDYLEKYTDCPHEFAAHLKTKTPQWAAEITGLSVAEIEEFAALIGATPRSFFRLGYGFARQRNGSVNMHAVTCIPAITGAWLHEGGGALHSNSGIYRFDKTMIEGSDVKDISIRALDQCRIGAVLTGDKYDLGAGPPITAMLIQNTNPVSVAPEQNKVKAGFAREDLFVCVHEQFMTETAAMADIVLPATMFLEHDDLYQGGGHQHILLGAKLIDAPGDCRSNHQVITGLAERLGLTHPGFAMGPRDLIDWTLQKSNHPPLAELEQQSWIDIQPDFDTAHFINGFGHADGKFRLRPDWHNAGYRRDVCPVGPVDDIPQFPDHWPVIEAADNAHPFRLATSPARTFLNSTFNETPSSLAREVRPQVLIHPDDLAQLNIADGAMVAMGNQRGEVRLHAKAFTGVKPGVLISEGIFPNSAFIDGNGINSLTGADQTAPAGGGTYHDNRVWLKAL